MVAYSQAGLFEFIADYMWGWFVYGNAMIQLNGCWALGGWGLFWANDDGVMMGECFKLFGGAVVNWPAVSYFKK